MYLRSARPRFANLPTSLLLCVLEYTVAAEWPSIIRLAGINRRFRKIIHEYVWSEIRELRVRAFIHSEGDFDHIYINGFIMDGLIDLEDFGVSLRPSQKFKDFLSYFLSMAENLECIELAQSTDPTSGQQGLHHLFDHLRSGIIFNARSVKEIAVRFTVDTSWIATTIRDVFGGLDGDLRAKTNLQKMIRGCELESP